MTISDLPRFAELFRREGGFELGLDDSFHETKELVRYLGELDLVVTNEEDVLIALNQLADEEEIAARPCKEGVAISHASDGWWLLLPYGSNLIEAIGGIPGGHLC